MRLIIASFALLLSACGFQPMYGSSNGPVIGPVRVAAMEGKAGHVLKTELDRILAPEAGAGGAPLELRIQLSESIGQLGIRLDESASRAELRLIANYTVTPPNGRPIAGSVSTVVNYEIPVSAFGEIAAQDDARERAAETLAQRMRADLAMRLAHARRS